jgi:hypothetical protein
MQIDFPLIFDGLALRWENRELRLITLLTKMLVVWTPNSDRVVINIFLLYFLCKLFRSKIILEFFHN